MSANDKYKTKFNRLMGIVKAIKGNDDVQRKDLARICGGVSKETISRYIRILKDVLEYPIIYNQEVGTYEFYRNDYTDISNDDLNAKEVMILIMALDSLISFGGPEILTLQSKLISLLPRRYKKNIESIQKELGYNFSRPEKGDMEYISEVNKAILEKKMIELSYKPAFLKEDKMVSEIIPYGIVWQNDRCYLVAWDSKDEKIINYRLDRIDGLEIIDKEGTIPSDFNLKDYSARCWKMFFGELKEVVIKFDNSLRPLVEDKLDAEYYDIEEETEDYFILRSKLRGIAGLKIWLLSLGAKVEVIKPISLRQEIKAEAEKISAIYK